MNVMPPERQIWPAGSLVMPHPASRPNGNHQVARRRRLHSDDEWENIKPMVEMLYKYRGCSLKNTMEEIERLETFKASERKWKMMIDKWGFTKYRKRLKVWWPSAGRPSTEKYSIVKVYPITPFPALSSLWIVELAFKAWPTFVFYLPVAEANFNRSTNEQHHIRKLTLCLSRNYPDCREQMEIFHEAYNASPWIYRLMYPSMQGLLTAQLLRYCNECFWTTSPRWGYFKTISPDEFLNHVKGLSFFRNTLRALGYHAVNEWHPLRGGEEVYLRSIAQTIFPTDSPGLVHHDIYLLFKSRHCDELLSKISIGMDCEPHCNVCESHSLIFQFFSRRGMIAVNVPLIKDSQFFSTRYKYGYSVEERTGLWKDITSFQGKCDRCPAPVLDLVV